MELNNKDVVTDIINLVHINVSGKKRNRFKKKKKTQWNLKSF